MATLIRCSRQTVVSSVSTSRSPCKAVLQNAHVARRLTTATANLTSTEAATVSTTNEDISNIKAEKEEKKTSYQIPGPSPRDEPRFRYGDVLVLCDPKGERRLVGPLRPGIGRDTNKGRLNHDQIVGQLPMTTIQSHMGAKYTLHWPTIDEYTTKVKRQANIMYPKDATTAVHLLDLFPGAHVLEAGTGNGSMTMYIQLAIQAPGSHLDTVDSRNEHSLQAEQNIERFWRGMYRPGITFWRSSGGLEKVIKRLTGKDMDMDKDKDKDTVDATLDASNLEQEQKDGSHRGVDKAHSTRSFSALERRRKKIIEAKEMLPENPHPAGHQYDAICLDLPDCKSVLLDLYPLLKPDRPLVLYMVNMSQILEMVQWLRRQNFDGYSVEKVVEVDWKEWSVRSAAVRSKVKGRVHVGGFGHVSALRKSSTTAAADPTQTGEGEGDKAQDASFTQASDSIPDDAVGWVCRPLHMPIGHTGFLVQLRKSSLLPEDFQ
ncbi:hypothetical protein BGZ94_001094 [Podila epigama]|nr:hypothetical protein BGZ94_001094 [Podila epigama]